MRSLLTRAGEPASSMHTSRRSTGVSSSTGSQAAPALAMAACMTSRSIPRGIHRPTMSPGRMPASIRRDAARLASSSSSRY
jgi:hypothetical protein